MSKSKNHWLLKTEPEEFSLDDLKRKMKEPWTGVRNYQARNFMREMKAGDLCFIYHTGEEKRVVGVGKVVGKPYPDKKEPEWTVVDIAFVKKFKHPITLAEVKGDPGLRDMVLVRAARLSVQPIDKKHFDYVVALSSGK